MTKIVISAIIMFFMTVQLSFGDFTSSSYLVGPGDELMVSIRVQGALDDLNKLPFNCAIVIIGESVYSQYKVIVSPDGFITIPSMQPVKVIERNVEQIKELVAKPLGVSGKNLAVSVELLRPNNYAYFITGEVKQPGRYVLERKTNLMEAIASAGGFTEKAKTSKIKLIRNGRLTIYDFSEIGKVDFDNVEANDMISITRKKSPDTLAVMLFLSIISTLTGIYAASK